MDVNSRRKTTSSKLARISHFFNFGKTLALVLFGMLLAVVLVSGCSGTVGSTQATNPPQLTYKISVAPLPPAAGVIVHEILYVSCGGFVACVLPTVPLHPLNKTTARSMPNNTRASI